MKLPSFKRILSTDFQDEYKGLVNKLAVSINDGLESVYNALNKRITLKDNIQCTVKTVQVTVNASGLPTTTTTFQVDVPNTKVEGCMVISAINQVNTTSYPSSGVFISFTQLENTVRIDHVTGIQANVPYSLKIVAFN
jgi:hypothetical protein